jgi:hypothetical protein
MKKTVLLWAFVLLVTLALPASARRWTSADGRFTVDAELVEVTDGQVTLKKRTGETITVPVEKLSELDRRWLQAPKKKPPAAKEPPKSNVISFAKDVQPLLIRYCEGCHSAINAKDGYDVSTYAALTRNGKKGALVVPGRPDSSRLIATMQGKGKPMPPKEYPQPTAEEITKMGAWIAAGAMDDTPPPAAKTAPGKGNVPPRKK